MTAHVERDFDFQAGVYFKNTFLMNVYSFTLEIEVNTDSIHEQNVAMDRLKYMIYEVFENSIFVSVEETEVIKKYNDAGLKVCLIPEEPYDQIVALIVMLKLNAVCEDRLKITDVNFTSKLSDEVRFKETIFTAEATYGEEAWYNESSPNLQLTTNKKIGKEKIVKIKNNEWKDTGLLWREKKDKVTEITFSIDPEKT